jgi:hypothetical protein
LNPLVAPVSAVGPSPEIPQVAGEARTDYGAFLAARAAVRCHRRRQCAHAAIAARADYEHAAIMRGDNWRGTFGRYQPASWWRA